MALSERMMTVLAQTVARALVADDLVSCPAEAELARRVERILLADREAELRINDEAKQLLQKHASEINRQNMDTGMLYQKFRAQLAKERGVVL